jgi:hypothetical protein
MSPDHVATIHSQSRVSHDDESIKQSAFHVALLVVQSLVRPKIRNTTILKTGKRNGVGVLLYDTKSRTPRIDETASTAASTKSRTRDQADDDDDDALYGALQASSNAVISTVHDSLIRNRLVNDPCDRMQSRHRTL